MTTDLPTFVRADATAPVGSWSGWTVKVSEYKDDAGFLWMLLVTYRTGDTGRSDAQYTVDRLASGLYPAKVVEIEPKREPVDISMFTSVDSEGGTYVVKLHANDGSGTKYGLPLGRISLDRALQVCDVIVGTLKKGWV